MGRRALIAASQARSSQESSWLPLTWQLYHTVGDTWVGSVFAVSRLRTCALYLVKGVSHLPIWGPKIGFCNLLFEAKLDFSHFCDKDWKVATVVRAANQYWPQSWFSTSGLFQLKPPQCWSLQCWSWSAKGKLSNSCDKEGQTASWEQAEQLSSWAGWANTLFTKLGGKQTESSCWWLKMHKNTNINRKCKNADTNTSTFKGKSPNVEDLSIRF